MTFTFSIHQAPILAPPSAPFRQSALYADLMRNCGVTARWIIAERESVAAAQWLLLTKRRFLAWWNLSFDSGIFHTDTTLSHRERAALYNQLFAYLKPKTKGLLAIGAPANHHLALQTSQLKEIMTPRHDLELDLSPSLSELRAGLHGKWRSALKKAEAAKLTVVQVEGSKWLETAERKQRRRRRYFGYPAGFQKALNNSGAAMTFLAYGANSQEPIAGMQFILCRETAIYHLAATTDEGRNVNAHNILLWRAIKQLKLKEVTTLSFGPCDSDSESLARFKQRTGAIAIDKGSLWG